MRGSAVVKGFEATSFLSVLPDVSTAVRPRVTGPTTEEEIEAAKQAAASEGFNAGYQDGVAAGFEQGHEQGLAAGQQAAYLEAAQAHAEALQAFIAELGGVLQSVQRALPQWCDRAEEAMADVAMDAVRSILSSELSLSRDSALEIVREALTEVTHARHARVRVNPFDSPVLAQYRGELLAASASLRDLEFVDDPNIRGGCVIETDGGVVDAQIETRLRLLEGGLEAA